MCGKSIGWCNGATDLAGVKFLGYSKEVLYRGIVLLDLLEGKFSRVKIWRALSRRWAHNLKVFRI
jgi:hypothetical protein